VRAEPGVASEVEQLRVQAAAVTAREEHERLLGQLLQMQAALAALRQRVAGAQYRDQGFAHQLDHVQ